MNTKPSVQFKGFSSSTTRIALSPDKFLSYFGFVTEPSILSAQFKEELFSEYLIIKLHALSTTDLLERFYENGTYCEYDLAEPLSIRGLAMKYNDIYSASFAFELWVKFLKQKRSISRQT
eukprot:468724_1